ncbi:MAG: CRISPR-associated endonuclease Cas2 [Vallitaleaceae bacterium]|nr:CRISPR-associated endonuclease Cas2 [Vallitaleaceae bacterium]
MRIIILFDLPVTNATERRAYTKFRKGLINEGFIMLQESVYCKLALNMSAVNLILTRITKLKPGRGLIQALVITEKQYGSIINMVGEQETNVINDCGRLTIL